MSYQLHDALKDFDFTDSFLNSISFSTSNIHFYLENVKILSSNPANKDIVTKRTNDMELIFVNGKILQIVEEGYQLYDADMKPYKKVEDRNLPIMEYENVLQSFHECYIDEIKQNNKLYTIIITVEDHTWRIEIEAVSTKQCWSKFLNM